MVRHSKIASVFFFGVLSSHSPLWADAINSAATTALQATTGASNVNRVVGMTLIPSGISLTRQKNDPASVSLGISFIAMGILAVTQGHADSGAATQSGQTAAVSSSTNAPIAVNEARTASAPVATDNLIAATLATPTGQRAINAVADAGGKMTAAGVIMPDGRKIPFGVFASPQTMQAAGFNGAAVAQKLASIEKTVRSEVANPTNPGTVSGMDTASIPGSASSGTSTALPTESSYQSPFDLTLQQKESLIAGKTVLLNGQPVGVKADNLLSMVHRAYARHEALGDFLPPPAPKNVAPALQKPK